MQDLISAYEFFQMHFEAPSLLIDHSLGGADDLDNNATARHIGEITAALLIFHTPLDEVVSIPAQALQ